MIDRLAPLKPIGRLFLRSQGRRLAAGAALALATALAGLFLLGLAGWFLAATAIAGLTVATALAFDVFAPSAGIRFFALARTGGRYGERLVTHDATLRMLAALRERLFRGWAAPGAARALARRPARLLFRLTLDIDALDSLYLRVAVPLVAALGVALTAGLMLGLMTPWLGLAVLALLLVAGLGLPLAAALAADRPSRRRGHGLEVLRARAINLVSGQTDWLMAGRMGAAEGAVAAADGYLAAADDRLNRIEAAVGLGLGLVGAGLLAALLVAVAALAQAGTIGTPVAVLGLMVALAVLEPFGALRRGAVELGRSLMAARRVAPRLGEAAEPMPAGLPPSGSAVRLDDVSLRHEGARRDSLSGISLTIAAGERVALVGPSGAGKSTLLALIAGEAAPSAGRVERLPSALLTQRTELFQDSLRDNLRLAAPDADDARLTAALETAGLAGLPEGLETRLGEGGHGLSGGQARRLALARLILSDAPLWLMDEPTEGLDGATARDVLRRVEAARAGRTLVIATHIRREAEAADLLVSLGAGAVQSIVRPGEPGFAAVLASLRPD